MTPHAVTRRCTKSSTTSWPDRFTVRVLDGESGAEALLGLDGNLLGDDLIGAAACSATAQEDAFRAIADQVRFKGSTVGR